MSDGGGRELVHAFMCVYDNCACPTHNDGEGTDIGYNVTISLAGFAWKEV